MRSLTSVIDDIPSVRIQLEVVSVSLNDRIDENIQRSKLAVYTKGVQNKLESEACLGCLGT